MSMSDLMADDALIDPASRVNLDMVPIAGMDRVVDRVLTCRAAPRVRSCEPCNFEKTSVSGLPENVGEEL